MPFYSWTGINLEGNICRGKLFARSTDDLEIGLLNKDIGIIKYKIINPNFFDLNIIGSKKTEMVNHISTLLNAQIRLPQALAIVSGTAKNFYFKSILEDISRYVSEGTAFSAALAFHGDFFDKLTHSVVIAGEKTGNLGKVLFQYSEHCKVIEQFKKQIKSAIFIPILTLVFFVFILIGIFLFVVPKFEAIFLSYKEPLPYATQIILATSQFLRSGSLIYLFSISITLFLLTKFLLKHKNYKRFYEKIIFKIPGFGNFWLLVYKTRFLQIMNILIIGGVHVLESLQIARDIIGNLVIAEEINKISKSVESGKSLSLALNESKIFYSTELMALVTIGESSADLGTILKQAADYYQDQVYSIINRISSLIQPMLLIFLGLLIAGLVFAIYMPMFTLSSIIS